MIPADIYRQKTDEALVSLSLKNKEAFAYLVNRYQARLARYIRRISKFDEEETADILQDVFIKTYLNLNDFDKWLKFSAWIYRITHNQVISQYRRLKVRPQAVIAIDDESVINKFTDGVDLARDLDQKYSTAAVRAGLRKLSYRYQEVLVLRYLEEKSYEEISVILRKPIATVGTLINRAKKELQQLINKDHI